MIPADSSASTFNQAISAATRPINGQYPRPWMTDLINPLDAEVLIVGRNPARTYDASMLTHERYLDALFNRNGQSCRALYDELVEPSATRRNIDMLHRLLTEAGVDRVLETNVICYSSPMSADLGSIEHTGGRATGKAVFRLLLDYVRPRVLIAHGAATARDLADIVGSPLPLPATEGGAPTRIDVGGMTIMLLPSLAPPAWNRWQRWAREHLEAVAALAARSLESTPEEWEGLSRSKKFD
jgi:uracil-DNA glycosylase